MNYLETVYESEPPVTALEVEWDRNGKALLVTCRLGADALTHTMEPAEMDVLHKALGDLIVTRTFEGAGR